LYVLFYFIFNYIIFFYLFLYLDDKNPNIKKMKCISIAPPACFSSSNENFTSHISSIVLGDDIVPRLSFVSITKLLSFSSILLKDIPGISNLMEGKKNINALKKIIHSILPLSSSSSSSSSNIDSQLLPAASLHHLTYIENDICIPRILSTSPSYFKLFIISQNGLKHHRLDMYRFYLASVISKKPICLLNEN